MRGIGLSRGGFWGFLSLAFGVGLIIGIGLLVWQRATFGAEVSALEKRLASRTTQAKSINEELSDLREQLDSTEASVDALASQNASLTSELASTTAALEAARKSTTTTTASGPVTITGLSSDPSPVPAGGQYTITVTLKGSATRVKVHVLDVQKNLNYTKDFEAEKVSSSGGVETWRVTATGPAAGHYHFWAYAYQGIKEVARNNTGQFSSN